MSLSTMRAERFYADTQKVVLEDVPIPEPGAGEDDCSALERVWPVGCSLLTVDPS